MQNWMSFFGFDKLSKISQIIRQNGGLRASFLKLYRFDNLKTGCLIGVDKYGNRYYENPYYFFGQNRWVEYADHVNMNYDGSQIPPEWHGWMHHRTDIPPTKDKCRPKYDWMLDHSENLTNKKDRYMPFSTTRPKIQAWDPKNSSENSKEVC